MHKDTIQVQVFVEIEGFIFKLELKQVLKDCMYLTMIMNSLFMYT